VEAIARTLFPAILAVLFATVLISFGAGTVQRAEAAQTPSPAHDSDATQTAVWVTKATGIIDPALARFLAQTMGQAADAKAAALVIQMDTPGGLDTAMRQIIQSELDSPVPVVVYVHPEGARAASAGVYILMGSDVAAMSPQTNLGAATPVALGGDVDETMKAKITNDAAAYIVALAETHGRNATWAEEAVRKSVSLPADQALAQNVVDFVAPDLPSLLAAINGFVTQPKGLTLHTAGAPIHEVEMSWVSRFLHAIANPDIAYILLTIGVLAIIYEIANPGIGVGGVVGVIALLLAFYALAVLPVSLVGIALMVLAVALFIAEIFITSHGILGVGGAIALIAGGLLLFDTSASFLRVSWPVLAAVAIVALAFFTLVITKVRGAMRRPRATGAEALVGLKGVALSAINPWGQVRVRGEIWRARTEGQALLKDEPIEVVRVEGLTLVVQRAAGSETGP
jgi:membrane-bound serine protease (ClpP class)